MNATNRMYRCKHTGVVYTKYQDPINHQTKLIDNNGNEATDYYASAINGVQYKYPDGSIIELNAGEFINNFKTVCKPTHKKYSGQKRFRKIQP